MKRIMWYGLVCLLMMAGSIWVPVAAQPAANGYEIEVTIKPFKNQWVYLAYHYGRLKGLADSAYLDANSRGVFKGKEALPQGIYIMASPGKTILFEMLMGADQAFSVALDTIRMEDLSFKGSDDNADFLTYTKFISPRAMEIENARRVASDSLMPAESKTAANNRITGLAGEMQEYRDEYVVAKPESLMSAIFKSMKEIKVPDNLKTPKTRADTVALYRYNKEHYWDEIDLMDGRLVRTPILEQRLKEYLESWVVPDADSIITEFNWMIALGRNDPTMFRYLISYYIDNYMYPKVMGHDKVFLHVYNRFIGVDNAPVDWLNENQMKVIKERAYMVMANQLGATAWDMALEDANGATKSLYNVKAPYTVVVFWDVHCGKCREEMPKMDSIYKAFWKQKGVQVYAVMVNEDNIKDWKPYILENGKEWVHVHEPKRVREEVEKSGKPNFRQLYDMRSTPTLFLLDKDKKIIAKNIGLTDLNELLKRKIAAG